MTVIKEELPSYYQPDSRLHLRLTHDDNILTLRVIKAFTPFTMAQVIQACIEENEKQPNMALGLPETFALKIYDPRFYSHRLPYGSMPARPWTLEAERAAADIRARRPPSITPDPDFQPHKKPEEDDKPGWEE